MKTNKSKKSLDIQLNKHIYSKFMKTLLRENPFLTDEEIANETATQFNLFIDEIDFEIPTELTQLVKEVLRG